MLSVRKVRHWPTRESTTVHVSSLMLPATQVRAVGGTDPNGAQCIVLAAPFDLRNLTSNGPGVDRSCTNQALISAAGMNIGICPPP